MKSQKGLTLVEVMVAMAITSIALIAAGQSMGSLVHGAHRQEQVTFAQLCAENALVAISLGREFPAIGQRQHACTQEGQQFNVAVHVSATANPSFRRVQAQAIQDGQSVLSISTVVGRY